MVNELIILLLKARVGYAGHYTKLFIVIWQRRVKLDQVVETRNAVIFTPHDNGIVKIV